MKKTAVLILILMLTACSSPTVDKTPTGNEQQPTLTQQRGIDRLLLEAGRTTPLGSTELKLQAARLAIDEGDAALATRIIESIEAPFVTTETTRDFSFLASQVALINEDPRTAIRILDDRRFQSVPLDEQEQITLGRLRADAYLMGRSYLASARELIYINRLLPVAERPENHERTFSALLQLSEKTLEQQAQQSITSEIRGWLSLAAMTKRYQHDPLRQLNALKKWQQAWASHPAALMVPSSLQMLSRIVEERPENIALILPLNGELGPIGRAIRDGYIAAHYQLTPDARLKVYDANQGDILELMSRAVADGAELIIGPLDRAMVTAVAQQPLKVPVIALNRTLNGEVNPNLYQFGLAPEDESIQVAEQIAREGRLSGLVIAPDTEWGDRNFEAFSGNFLSHGGVIVDSARFTDQRDYSELVKGLLNVDSSEQRAAELRRITGERFEFTARRRQDIDFVFLLSNSNQARGINPTLAFFYAEDVPVYSTSHVHSGPDTRIDAIDMNGIRFCDIPWKLTAEDETQQLIQKIWSASASSQFAPFYALGVDVHRLYPRLQKLKEFPNERIYGSTGILTLNQDNIVNRTLMWAQFREGKVSTIPMMFDAVQ